MAASTRSRGSGATLGDPLTTRETVWWETPARTATSDMTSARGAPSGCTVLPPPRQDRDVPGPPRRPRAPGLVGGPRLARARAPLVVDVEGDGEQEYQALDHRLDGLVDAHQLHAVAHDADEQTAHDGPDDGAHAAGDGRATDEARGDRVELERQTGSRLRAVGPGREDDAGDRRQHAHVHEDLEVDRADLDAGQRRRGQVAADRVHLAAEDGPLGDQAVGEDQHGQDDQHDRQAAGVRQLPGEPHDDSGDDDEAGHEEREGLDRLLVADPRHPGAEGAHRVADDRGGADKQREGVVAVPADEPVEEAGGDLGVLLREGRQRDVFKHLLRQPAEREHAGPGDDEGADPYVGDPETLPATYEDAGAEGGQD